MSAGSRHALVTGGAGFIGSHLVDALLAGGWCVTALDDLSTGSRRNVEHLVDERRFQLVEGSVLDPACLRALTAGADCVFHLAAAVGVKLIVGHPLQSMLTNIRGTETVLEAAQRRGVKVLLTSSSEIYGKSQDGPLKEDDDRLLGHPRKLRWSYSTAKAVDEVLAYAYHRDLGLPTIVIRLFNTVGPRQTGRYGMVLPRFVQQAVRGEPLTVYGDGRQTRVFTYVGDVVQALIRLMEAAAAVGGVFNVAGHREVSIEELARLVVERTGSRSPLTHVDCRDVYGEGFEESARRVADTSRLEAVTGYRCETGLEEMIDSVIAHLGMVPGASR